MNLTNCLLWSFLPAADKMTPAQERGVRRALGFAETLDHPSLVRCMGNWEDEDIIYIGGACCPPGHGLERGWSIHAQQHLETLV